MPRRKILKKSEFDSFPNTYDIESFDHKSWSEHFGNPHPIVFELGCGKAEFIYEQAQSYPDKNYVGIDVKADRLWRPAKDAIEASMLNLAFIRAHLRSIDTYVGENEADEMWITFPDPFRKSRQAKHRMTHKDFIPAYQKVLKKGGFLHLKTDDIDLFHFSLETFVAYPAICLHELSFDLHEAEHIDDYCKVKTTYEKKFLEMGKKINYVKVSFE
ncbi:MAG: tRNA (guanosine(46)-N7)-methyltransferase TrmB [Bacteroidota bacterium]